MYFVKLQDLVLAFLLALNLNTMPSQTVTETATEGSIFGQTYTGWGEVNALLTLGTEYPITVGDYTLKGVFTNNASMQLTVRLEGSYNVNQWPSDLTYMDDIRTIDSDFGWTAAQPDGGDTLFIKTLAGGNYSNGVQYNPILATTGLDIMSISTYQELKVAISAWSKRNDISSVVDDFIHLAESEMWMHLRIRDMEEKETALSISGREIEIPDDYVGMRRLRYAVGGQYYDMNYSSPEALKPKAASGLPGSYTVSNVIELDRTPTDNYSWELLYYKCLTELSNDSPSNKVLERFPNVYLTGSLWALSDWAMKEPAEVENQYQKFKRAMDAANDVDRRGRKGAAPQARSGRRTP